jgi:aminopeptidase N
MHLKSKITAVLAGCLCTFSGIILAQKTPTIKSLPFDSASVPRERFADFQHLDLQISFETQLGKVIGEATHSFQVLRQKVDSLYLDGPGISIQSIQMEGKPLKFNSRQDKIWIYFNEPLTWNKDYKFQVSYEAFPRKGIYFIGWNDPTGRARKQIWTQGQGTDNRCWIPMFDYMNDKIKTDIHVKMDKSFKVLSNGALVDTKNDGNNLIWHYKMSNPHAPYLIMLGIGDYGIEKRKSKSGVEMDLYYYPDQPQKLEPTYRLSQEMFDFFEQEIGVKYPWVKYSQIPVQEFMYGAMENTTATVFGDFFYTDARGYLDRKYVGVNAHELAHQWFGDMVTAIAPTHHWLQESFATHYNMMYEKEAFGSDYYDQARRNAQRSALNASTKDLYPIASSDAGSTRWYPKGAVVLQMLKYVVGKDAFNRAVKYYLERNPYGNVDSHDLLRAFHETSGESLDWFWEQWIYRGGEPSYAVSAVSDQNKTTFNVAQLQKKEPYIGLFKMPIWFEVWFTDGTSARKQVWISEEKSEVEIDHPTGKKVAYTLFDPNNEIMKSVEFSKPIEQLKLQLKSSKFMLDRLDALSALMQFPKDQTREAFQEAFRKDPSVQVKNMAVVALQGDKHKSSIKVLHEALKHSHHQVRQNALESIDTLSKDFFVDVELLLKDSSYATFATALEKLAEANPKKLNEYLKLTASETGDNARNIRFTWLKLAINNQQKQYIDELIDLSSESFEFNTRRAAFSLLKELKISNEKAASYAMNAAKNPNNRLANGGLGYLIWLYKEEPNMKPTVQKLMDSLGNSDWESKIKERIVAGK